MSSFRPHLRIFTDWPFEDDPTPERKLLNSILGRAIYDLRPEAAHEQRRDAITWFREPDLDDKNPITSFHFIRIELCLGQKMLGLIQQALDDALAFEEYYVACTQQGKKPDINFWLSGKQPLINTTRRQITPQVRYQKIFSFIE